MRFCAAAASWQERASILFAFPSEGVCAFFAFVRSCARFEANVQIWVATLVIHLSCSLQAYRTTSTSSQHGEKVAKIYLPAHCATLSLLTHIKPIFQTRRWTPCSSSISSGILSSTSPTQPTRRKERPLAPLLEQRGDGGTVLLTGTAPSVSQGVVSLFPVSYLFHLNDVLNNLPSSGSAGALHCQPRTWYAAGAVEFETAEGKKPSEVSRGHHSPLLQWFSFVCVCLWHHWQVLPRFRDYVILFCRPRLAISCHRGRRLSCELLQQAPPIEQGQLICKSSGVDCRIQGSSGCVAVRHVSC